MPGGEEWISIHAPHEGERHGGKRAIKTAIALFQSTLPTRGSDIAKGADLQIISEFQSTLPTRGSDDVG